MSEALSAVTPVSAPRLTGAWLHRLSDPEGTAINFRYAGAKKRTLAPTASLQWAVGRALPVAEYGDGVDDRLALTVVIPYDENHDAGVQWWEDAALSGEALCYRDNRGRVIFTSLTSGVGTTDERTGMTVTAVLPRIDYSEAL